MAEPKVFNAISSSLIEIKEILSNNNNSKSVLKSNTDKLLVKGDEIKGILNEIVNNSKKTKAQEISIYGAIGSFSKSAKKIEKIGDEISGIRKTLLNTNSILEKILSKSNNGNNIKNNDIKNVLNDSLKTLDNKNQKLMSMINIISQLGKINLKDFLFANTKIKKLGEIYDKLLETFSKFKDDKQVKKVNEFALSAVNVIKSLSKISVLSIFAEKGANTINTIFFGKDGNSGLVGTLVKMKKHKKDINDAKKTTSDLVVISGKILLVSLFMTGVAILGLPALVGAVLTSAMIGVFGLVFSVIGKFDKQIDKGNRVIAPMMISVILAGIGLFLINKATKDLEWEQLAKASVAILAFGLVAFVLGSMKSKAITGALVMGVLSTALVIAGFGLYMINKATKDLEWGQLAKAASTILIFGLGAMALGFVAIPVAIGSMVMVLLSGAMIVLGYGVKIFGENVTDEAIDKISYGIPRIFKAITSIFDNGDTKDGKGGGFGSGIIGIILGCLKIGGAVFAAGALMLIGFSLGFVALCLKPWEDFDTKAIDNLEYTIGKIQGIFGIDVKGEGSIAGSVMSGVSDLIGLGGDMLKMGRTFIRIATLALCVGISDLLRLSLEHWSDFDKKSVDNLEYAIGKLTNIFGIEFEESGGGLLGTLLGTSTNVLGIGSDLFKMGRTMIKLATLTTCVGVVDLLIDTLNKWGNYDIKSVDGVFDVMSKINNFFGLDDNKNYSMNTSLFSTVSSIFGVAGGLYQMGAKMQRLATYSVAIGVIDKLMYTLVKINNVSFEANNTIDNIFDVFRKIDDFFMTSDDIYKINDFSLFGLFSYFNNSPYKKLSIYISVVDILDKMAESIIKMKNVTPEMMSSFNNIIDCFERIMDYMFSDDAEHGNILNKIYMPGVYRDNFEYMYKSKIGVISSVIGLIKNVSDAISSFSKTRNIENSMQKIFYVFDELLDYFFGDDSRLKKTTESKSILGMEFVVPKETCADALVSAVDLLKHLVKSFGDDDFKSGMKNIQIISSNVLPVFGNLVDFYNKLNSVTYSSDGNTLKTIIKDFVSGVNEAAKNDVDDLVNKSENLMKIFNNIGGGKEFISTVNNLNVDKANAFTNMFNAFNKINNTSNTFYSNFEKNVKLFTKACTELISAVNGNTTALSNQNNQDVIINNYDDKNDNNNNKRNKPKGIEISNVDEIAQMIAQYITNSLSDGMDSINLSINGEGGNEWIIRRY